MRQARIRRTQVGVLLAQVLQDLDQLLLVGVGLGDVGHRLVLLVAGLFEHRQGADVIPEGFVVEESQDIQSPTQLAVVSRLILLCGDQLLEDVDRPSNRCEGLLDATRPELQHADVGEAHGEIFVKVMDRRMRLHDADRYSSDF